MFKPFSKPFSTSHLQPSPLFFSSRLYSPPHHIISYPTAGKSVLGRRLATMGGGGIFFERLLTKYSNPEELFGPLSLSALERDEYVRNTEVSVIETIPYLLAFRAVNCSAAQ